MNLRSTGTSPATENATGKTNATTVIALTAPAPQTKAARDDYTDDLNAIYENGELKYTTSIFENLSKEYHPDLINLIIYATEKHEYFKIKADGITNLCRDDFYPKRLRAVLKIHLENHDDTAQSSVTCSNLQKWKDHTTQYQDDIKHSQYHNHNTTSPNKRELFLLQS